jgi:hypothetical protein
MGYFTAGVEFLSDIIHKSVPRFGKICQQKII